MVSGAVNQAAPQNDADGNLFLVNRQWMVTDAYEPADLAMSDVPGQVRKMRPEAAEALREMFAACKEETGLTLLSVSGYRSYEKQDGLFRHKLRNVKKNMAKAMEYVAPPGASEHQTGLAMDIGQKHKETLEVSFAKMPGGIWCRENCWRFGFILRYGEEWEEITGYKYEPWHFRYVGREYAKEITEANIPYETWMIQHRVKVLKELLGDAAVTARDWTVQEEEAEEPAKAGEPAESPESEESGESAASGEPAEPTESQEENTAQ